MSNYTDTDRTAIFLFKKEELGYRYKILEGSTTNLNLFQFLSRVINSCPQRISTWIKDDSMSDYDKNTYRIQICIYPPNDIINEGPTENVVPFSQNYLILSDDIKTPILHILLTDLLSYNLYEKKKKLHPSVPRYFQIIDSSIWNHYVPMVKFDESDKGFHALFSKAVDEIIENHRYGLYDVGVAKEFADVNARVLQQSYLRENHSRLVAPFIFHSETTIEKLIKEKLENDFKALTDGFGNDKWRWRFLLIDDRAIEKEKGKLKGNCKLSIIMRLIVRALFPGKTNWVQYRLLEQKEGKPVYSYGEIDTNAKIVIDCAQHYDDAIAALKDQAYDIILLDYLLDAKKGLRRFGYEILEEINNDHEKQFKIGPCGKLFFIFISAYSNAVNERLLSQGLGRREDHWFINTGACPTNTPQLFSYNLLHLMNHRLDDCGILKLSIDEMLKLVAKIFRPNDKKDDKKDSVRKRASLYYHNVLTLQYHYRRMLDDVEIPPRCNFELEQIFNIKKSVLISYYNEHQHLSGLLEHLTNLVHIAAFGTIRQWDEMWEEYLYFKAQFKVLISKEKEENQNDNIAGIFQRVCGHIESFILELKSQQR